MRHYPVICYYYGPLVKTRHVTWQRQTWMARAIWKWEINLYVDILQVQSKFICIESYCIIKLRRVQSGIGQARNPLELSSLRGALIYDKPNPKLYDFTGKLVMQKQEL